MRKYRTKRWPFFICLFSGLACSLTLPPVATKKESHSLSGSIHPTKKVEAKNRECHNRNHNESYNEGYPVGPQLLLVLQ